MKNEKQFKPICPMLLQGALASTDHEGRLDSGACDCVGSACAWWVRLYTTENILDKGQCAMTAIAEKNSDGKKPV